MISPSGKGISRGPKKCFFAGCHLERAFIRKINRWKGHIIKMGKEKEKIKFSMKKKSRWHDEIEILILGCLFYLIFVCFLVLVHCAKAWPTTAKVCTLFYHRNIISSIFPQLGVVGAGRSQQHCSCQPAACSHLAQLVQTPLPARPNISPIWISKSGDRRALCGFETFFVTLNLCNVLSAAK